MTRQHHWLSPVIIDSIRLPKHPRELFPEGFNLRVSELGLRVELIGAVMLMPFPNRISLLRGNNDTSNGFLIKDPCACNVSDGICGLPGSILCQKELLALV